MAAAIFLPLSFLTGLLGVNLGGIPGAESSWGFAAVVGIVVVVLAVQLWFLRRRRWL